MEDTINVVSGLQSCTKKQNEEILCKLADNHTKQCELASAY